MLDSLVYSGTFLRTGKLSPWKVRLRVVFNVLSNRKSLAGVFVNELAKVSICIAHFA